MSAYALALGTAGSVFICSVQFGIRPALFFSSSLEAVRIGDLSQRRAEDPIFGFLIAIIGCHFGLRTTGGTEGVGSSTTRTVVAVSIAILICEFLLTKLFLTLLLP